MTNDLSGQRVLVIGASGGIGSATADAFKAAGADVSRPARATLDITDDASVAAFFDAEQPFDHVVIAAAATRTGTVADLDMAHATASMDNKFFGAYRVARAASVKDHGSITFVSGFLANRPTPGTALQGAINAAVDALARGLALERAPVRVNSVSPGTIDTPLWHRLPEGTRTAMFARVADRLPVGKIGRPEDVARAILFVATNPFVTGSSLLVDGGGTIAG